jgi:hypothetical protein
MVGIAENDDCVIALDKKIGGFGFEDESLIMALAAQAAAGGYVSCAQAQRALGPLLEGLVVPSPHEPRWIAVPTVAAAAVEAAIAEARSKRDRMSSTVQARRGRTVVTGPAVASEGRAAGLRVAR